jgi:hypothetical protein
MKFSGRFKSRLEANVGIGGCVSSQQPIAAIPSLWAPTPLDLDLLSKIRSRGWIAQTLRSCRPSRLPDIQIVRVDDYHVSLPRIELGNLNQPDDR